MATKRTIKSRAVAASETTQAMQLHEEVTALRNNEEYLVERLAELELAQEDREYLRLTLDADREFSREGLQKICRIARVYWLKNPLIQRAVNVKRLYVWGQGVSVRAQDVDINRVLQDFMNDHKNQQELTSHEARMMKETELEVDGNIFFVLFTNISTGKVRLRSIPLDEVLDIITDPQDRKMPWYYKRQWTDNGFNIQTGNPQPVMHTEYYPDWRYDPTTKPQSIGGYPVNWEQPVYHVKINTFSDWRFGVPEVYAALDWARAYKTFLENWSSIVAAYARFAWQLKTTGGASGIASAKAKLQTTVSAGSQNSYIETNPPPVTAATFIRASDQVTLEPVKTAGATTSSNDGRRLLLMVCAAAGLPETFMGDATAGSLATARSLDRPTELMMRDRQVLWMDVHDSIFNFVVLKAVESPSGALASKGQVIEAIDGGIIEKEIQWNSGEDGGVDDHIDIEFPPMVQLDMDKLVKSIVDAATLGNATGALAGTIDLQTVSRMLLVALGQDDVDEILGHIFPVDDAGNPIAREPALPQPVSTPPAPATESMMIEAVQDMRDALQKIMGRDEH